MKNLKVVKNEMEVVGGVNGVLEMVKVIEVAEKKNGSLLEEIMKLDLNVEMESVEKRSSRVKEGSKSEIYLYLLREGKNLSEIMSFFNRRLRGVKERNLLRKEGKLFDGLEEEVKVYYSEVERVMKKFIIGGYGDVIK